MPRGNPHKLKPPTAQEARERGALGGKRSQEVQRKKKSLRDEMAIILDMPIADYIKESLAEKGDIGLDINNMTNADLMRYKLYMIAIGNENVALNAMKYINEIMGNDPLLEIKREELNMKKRELEKAKENADLPVININFGAINEDNNHSN